jgi:polyphosphate kinase
VGARAFSGGGFSGAHSFGCRSGHSFPFLSNLSLSLSVELHDPVTRDMDLDVLEDAAEDLLSAVDRGVRERRFGAAVRLEVSPQLPPHIRQLLLEKLEIEEVDLYESQAPLGSSSLFQLASRNRPELRAAPLVQRMPQAWLEKGDPFSAIRAADVCLHHPYDSFTPVLDLLSFAAQDPGVLAIKMKLYRAGSEAEAMRARVRAAENGKQVAVSIELKARFDEANNIAWARARRSRSYGARAQTCGATCTFRRRPRMTARAPTRKSTCCLWRRSIDHAQASSRGTPFRETPFRRRASRGETARAG